MLLVKTILQPSPIHGLGLFAAETIKAGTIVWEFNPVLDRILPSAAYDHLPPIARSFAMKHLCFWEGEVLSNGDDARFINHSSTPNLGVTALGLSPDMFAIRDIQIGEEITSNYADYDEFPTP